MSPKTILVFCAQALLAQTAFSACTGGVRGLGAGVGRAGGCGARLAGGCGAGLAGGYGAGLAGGYGTGLAGGYGAGCGNGAAGVASTGGGLPISSASPIAPVGVSVVSENAYEGQLTAGGNLPFLGGVVIEGVLPTAGTGAVSYGCGDGAVGIANEAPIDTGILSGQSYAPSAGLVNQGLAGIGLGNAGRGLGAAGYGLGGAGCGLRGAGYGIGRGAGIAGCGARSAGCGCGARY